MNVTAKGTLNQADGTLAIDLEFSPASEVESEILAKFLDGTGKIELMHGHRGDVLKSSLVVFNKYAFVLGVHNFENRKRAADGRPSLEDEAAAAKAQADVQAKAKAEAKASKAKESAKVQ